MSGNTNPPSTVGSYVDSAIGAVQQVIGQLTGNTVDQVNILFLGCAAHTNHATDTRTKTRE
jgi:hypothetical protein